MVAFDQVCDCDYETFSVECVCMKPAANRPCMDCNLGRHTLKDKATNTLASLSAATGKGEA